MVPHFLSGLFDSLTNVTFDKVRCLASVQDLALLGCSHCMRTSVSEGMAPVLDCALCPIVLSSQQYW